MDVGPEAPSTAHSIIELLGLRPHPEGGHYVETWRGPDADGRATATAIYFLLRSGEVSHWHRVDADEVWLYHSGAPLVLSIIDPKPGSTQVDHRLGPDLAAGERPQAVVPAHHWQAASSAGDWTLVSCVVAPGFDFAGFELAAPGWAP
jgi:predicted cupin superfamily sugar epimerase